MADIKRILDDQKYLHNKNATWRSYYQEISSFCLPRKAWIDTPKTTGERLKFNFLYDSVAMRSLKIMAAGFHSNLTNPATKWYDFSPRNKRLQDSRAVMTWIRDAVDVTYSIINNSNFDTTMQEFYMDGGCFGTGALLTEEDEKRVIVFKNIPIEQIDLVEDSNGNVTEIFRNFRLTPRQAYSNWGMNIGKDMLELLQEKPYEEQDFLHYVGVRGVRDVRKIDAANKPIASVWIAVKAKHEIKEGGYDSMPYHIGRFWKDPTDPRGYSPAMDVLADIKLLNQQKKTALRRGMKEADPPLHMPDKAFMLPLNFNPSAINNRRNGVAADDIQPFAYGAGNFSITKEMMDDQKQAIEEGFFVPLFRALSQVNKEMTIPEVQRRVMENMVLLGPTVGRYTQDVLEPAIYRVLDQAIKRKLVPPPPEELRGQDLDVVYLSPLAKAQRESELVSIEGWLSASAQVAQFKPDALDIIDGDAVIRKIGKIRAVDPDLYHDSADVESIRKMRADMQARQQQLSMVEQGSNAARNIADARSKSAKAEAPQK